MNIKLGRDLGDSFKRLALKKREYDFASKQKHEIVDSLLTQKTFEEQKEIIKNFLILKEEEESNVKQTVKTLKDIYDVEKEILAQRLLEEYKTQYGAEAPENIKLEAKLPYTGKITISYKNNNYINYSSEDKNEELTKTIIVSRLIAEGRLDLVNIDEEAYFKLNSDLIAKGAEELPAIESIRKIETKISLE